MSRGGNVTCVCGEVYPPAGDDVPPMTIQSCYACRNKTTTDARPIQTPVLLEDITHPETPTALFRVSTIPAQLETLLADPDIRFDAAGAAVDTVITALRRSPEGSITLPRRGLLALLLDAQHGTTRRAAPNKTTATQVLRRAPAFLGTHSKGNEARDAEGKPVHPMGPTAVARNATGAIYTAVDFDGSPDARRLYETAIAALARVVGNDIRTWNDAPTRTRDDVIAALEKAAVSLEA